MTFYGFLWLLGVAFGHGVSRIFQENHSSSVLDGVSFVFFCFLPAIWLHVTGPSPVWALFGEVRRSMEKSTSTIRLSWRMKTSPMKLRSVAFGWLVFLLRWFFYVFFCFFFYVFFALEFFSCWFILVSSSFRVEEVLVLF